MIQTVLMPTRLTDPRDRETADPTLRGVGTVSLVRGMRGGEMRGILVGMERLSPELVLVLPPEEARLVRAALAEPSTIAPPRAELEMRPRLSVRLAQFGALYLAVLAVTGAPVALLATRDGPHVVRHAPAQAP
jgi:hypothetical protein